MTQEKQATTGETTRRGLLAMLAGGLMLISAVWFFAFYLGQSLAQVHMRHKVSGIADQAMDILREAGETLSAPLSPATGEELRRLMKYREVSRLDIADASGRVLWSSQGEGARAGRISTGAKGLSLRVDPVASEGMTLLVARAMVPVRRGQLEARMAMDIDVTGLLAWYRRIVMAIAKAVTVVILGGFFVLGAILFGRWRERAEQEAEVERLRRRNAEEHERMLVLQAQLERLNADMAALNRRLAAAMKSDKRNDAAKPPSPSQKRKRGNG